MDRRGFLATIGAASALFTERIVFPALKVEANEDVPSLAVVGADKLFPLVENRGLANILGTQASESILRFISNPYISMGFQDNSVYIADGGEVIIRELTSPRDFEIIRVGFIQPSEGMSEVAISLFGERDSGFILDAFNQSFSLKGIAGRDENEEPYIAMRLPEGNDPVRINTQEPKFKSPVNIKNVLAGLAHELTHSLYNANEINAHSVEAVIHALMGNTEVVPEVGDYSPMSYDEYQAYINANPLHPSYCARTPVYCTNQDQSKGSASPWAYHPNVYNFTLKDEFYRSFGSKGNYEYLMRMSGVDFQTAEEFEQQFPHINLEN